MSAHRVEKAVFTSRFNLVQFVSIVAQDEKGRNGNAKYVEHNHRNLFLESHTKANTLHEKPTI